VKTIEYDLLKMRHARAVANIYQCAASANREAALDGWLFDWAGAMREASAEAVACEHEIECHLNGTTPEEVKEDELEYRACCEPPPSA